MPNVTRPTVIVPGIEGSMLQNAYAITPSRTWSTWVVASSSFIAPDFDSLALADDATADRDEPVLTRPDSLLSIAYAKMVAGLQGRTDAPAYLFPYDWRYSNGVSAKLLTVYVERLLLKKIPTLPAWDGKFDFVCHSMGGLIFRAFLADWMNAHGGATAPVGRVVFIATPHHAVSSRNL
jgi:Lecithin:cholesterol acyltransferase